MAASATLLAWGAIDFKDAYEAAGQMEATLNTIRWATDYFIKCHPEENVLYAQVGITFEEKPSDLWNMTMTDKLMYIPKHYTQHYPFYRLVSG